MNYIDELLHEIIVYYLLEIDAQLIIRNERLLQEAVDIN
jgi:hypothetical protein